MCVSALCVGVGLGVGVGVGLGVGVGVAGWGLHDCCVVLKLLIRFHLFPASFWAALWYVL